MCFNNFLFCTALTTLTLALVSACGGGSGGAPTPPPLAVNNAIKITVDAGPPDSGYNVNRLYTDVTICTPGSRTQCQTIDHVLVDTGSSGLRLLSNTIAPDLKRILMPSSGSFPLLNCVQFIDNTFAWGPVVTTDIWLGDKQAQSMPIQIIADPTFNHLADACAVGATAITSKQLLGANGILGIGLFKEDCGSGCTATPRNGFYFTCKNSACTGTVGAQTSIDKQVKNPVPFFASDNNGVMIDLPSVAALGATSLNGSLIFGIGTQPNNSFTVSTVLQTNTAGNITTRVEDKNFNASFLDTGSNGLFFDSVTLPKCPGIGASYYCPNTRTTNTATLIGTQASALPVSVSVSIDNALSMFNNPTYAVLPYLSGPTEDTSTFVWGLPFFYGRKIFTGIEGQASSLGTGPFYSF